MNTIALLLLVVCLGQAYCVVNPKVVCYYDYWFVWRTGKDKFTVADLDSSLCTHIVYASLRVSYNGDIEYPDNDLMTGTGHDLAKFVAAKGHGKALASFLETSLANVAANPTTRTAFVTAVTHFLDTYQFDGIVLEHPTSPYNDDYVSLLHELRLQFGTKYTLGVTVGSTPGTYKAANVNKFVDFYAVQTFDYHGTWEMVVGHEAPINSVVTTLKAWVDAGAEPEKLLATIPMYARTWILAGADTLPGAKAQAAGLPGPWTQVAGKLGYNELCMAMEAAPAEWEVHPDTSVDAVYAVNKVSHTWVTFESPMTTKMKTNNITASGYGGIVAQPLENDDYGNYCAQGRYPLLKGINDGLDTSSVTHPTPGTSTSTTPVHVTPPPNQICQKTGTVRDPKDCNVYHKCTEFLPGVISDDVEHCAKGEAFDEKDLTCKDHTLVAGC